MTPSRGERAGLPRVLAAVLTCILLVGCGQDPEEEYSSGADGSQQGMVVIPELSDNARLGEAIFAANCAECHGADAAGSSQGPPLVHKIYEPGHHGDLSFHLAVRQGVRQHHWSFGNMDPRPDVDTQDIDKIVCYVRELQFANGIFADPDGLVACQS